VKMQPVFVSDAITRDVWRLVERMRERGGDARKLAERLLAGFEADRVAIAPDPFWSGPRFLWEAPAHLRSELGSATIVVLKGDANYRRLVGDAPWLPSHDEERPGAGSPRRTRRTPRHERAPLAHRRPAGRGADVRSANGRKLESAVVRQSGRIERPIVTVVGQESDRVSILLEHERPNPRLPARVTR
jgi:hypothetical protein